MSFLTVGWTQCPIVQWHYGPAVDLTKLGILLQPFLPEVCYRSPVKRFLLQHYNVLQLLNQTCSNLPAGITLVIIDERCKWEVYPLDRNDNHLFNACQVESDGQGMLTLDMRYSALKGNVLHFNGQNKISRLILRPDNDIEFKTNGTFSSLEDVIISPGIPGDKIGVINWFFDNTALPIKQDVGSRSHFSVVRECNLDWLKNAPSVKKLCLDRACKTVPTEPPSSAVSSLKELFVFDGIVDSTFLSQFKMSVMKKLFFSNCRLSVFPHEICHAKHLEVLVIHGAKFDNQSVILSSLNKLKYLRLEDCNFHVPPIGFNNLSELEYLDLSKNDVYDNELDLGSLNKLKQLFLRECKLNKFPKGLEVSNQLSAHETFPVLPKLHLLTSLNLSFNGLNKIPGSIFQLPKLEHLDISHNHLRELPETVTEMMRKNLVVKTRGNHLEKPPQVICNHESLNCETILKYFEDIKKFGEVHSHRLRVIVLGNSMAGKTSLVNALLSGIARLEPEEERTSGIEVRTLYTNLTDDSALELDMWDYAGQDCYQTLHNFYLHNGSLFLLVVDTFVYEMTDESYFGHVGRWIENIRAKILLPVFLVAANKVDLFKNDTEALKNKCQHIIKKIAEQERQEVESIQADISAHSADTSGITKLQQLKESRPILPDAIDGFDLQGSDQNTTLVLCSAGGIVTPSDYDDDDVNDVKVNDIHQELTRVSLKFFPFLFNTLPKLWKDIENQFTKLKETTVSKKYMSIEELDAWLLEQCPEYRDDDDRKSTLDSVLDYLVTIGKVLQFKDIPGLQNVVFFDPDWLNSLLREVVRHNLDTFVKYHSDFTNYSMDEINFDKEKRNLTQRGLVSKGLLCCIWHQFSKYYNIPREELLALCSLLENFNIGYKMTEKEAEIERYDYEKDYILIPSLMPDEPPSGIKDEWPESFSDDELEISCRYMFHSNVVTGLFELLMCRVHNGADYQVHWKHGFYGYVDEVQFYVRKEENRQKRTSSVVMSARIQKTESIRSIWKAMLNIHSAFYALQRESWPWLRYRIYNHCPKCNKDHHNFNFEELIKEKPAVVKTLRCDKKFPPKRVENPTLVYPSAEAIEEFRRENAIRQPVKDNLRPHQSTEHISDMLQYMDSTLRQKIANLLDKKDQQESKDARLLAQMVGMELNARDIAWQGRGESQAHPTQDILKWWQENARPTVKDLVKILEEMGRKDVLSVIYEVYPDLRHGS